jgi:hypothetical protein
LVLAATVSRKRRIAASATVQSGTALTKFAAEPDKHLGAAVHHCLYGVDDVVPASPRRLEAEHFLELVE